MPIPCCIDDYNHHMGRVDVAGQLRSYYDAQLASSRTWWPMFFWALDTMGTNAYFIYLDMSQASKTMAHEEFRLQCAWGMIQAELDQLPHHSLLSIKGRKPLGYMLKRTPNYSHTNAATVGIVMSVLREGGGWHLGVPLPGEKKPR